MSDINEVRERLEEVAEDFTERGLAIPTANDIRALLADHARLQAVSQELAAALAGVAGFVATDVVESCNGSKCREPWCAGCFGEEAAEQAASEARTAVDAVYAAVSKAVQP